MEDELSKEYRRDDEGRYIIHIKAENLNELYNIYDPSAFSERDLNHKAVAYLTENVVVLPHDAQLRIIVHLPKKFKKGDAENDIARAIMHHFTFDSLNATSHIKRRIRKGFNALIFGILVFITGVGIATYLKSLNSSSFFMDILTEGLYIGAWVSLWQPIYIILYEWLPLYSEQKIYKKLANAKINFNYF